MTTVLGLPPQLAEAGRCLVMGILNVTPDSFSDGGDYLAADTAIEHGLQMSRDGADIIDVGGESTRPGASRVPADEEQRRVLPVVRALAAAGAVVSIDTMRAEVARAALDEGASIVNDVSGGRADAAMAAVVAAARVPYVAMHWRAHSDTMQQRATYGDVVTDVTRELRARLRELVAAGVDEQQVILDPGIGFAKLHEHNWTLLAHLDVLQSIGRPVLIGASRKRFLDDVLPADDGQPTNPAARDSATAALSGLVAARGAWGVRVHDVRGTSDAVRVAAVVQRMATPTPPPSAGPTVALDRISIRGLRGFGRHGVYDEERATGQHFVVDLDLCVDTRMAAASDAVEDTVHYGELAQRVRDVVEGEPVHLLETLGQRIADHCLLDDRVAGVEVTVHKPDAPVGVPVTDVSVTVVRP